MVAIFWPVAGEILSIVSPHPAGINTPLIRFNTCCIFISPHLKYAVYILNISRLVFFFHGSTLIEMGF
jgi:hypothetical protein